MIIVKKKTKKYIIISNNNDELFEFNLSWLGYCLTGETSVCKMLFMIGYTAENGKSTMGRMYHYSLPIYSVEISNRTFDENYQNAHKQLASVQKPVRFCIVEELSRLKMNVEIFKKFVDGNEIRNEVLFSTTENLIIHAKLYVTSNHDPRFHTDNGIARRGLVENLQNKFVPKQEYNTYDDKTGIYIRDEQLKSNFEANNIYKLEFVRLLLPYAKQFYDQGIHIPSFLVSSFKDICGDNDNMNSFINKFYDVTRDKSDRVSKDDFMLLYNNYYNKKLDLCHVISDVKRLGIEYDRVKRYNGKKGVFFGIKNLEKMDENNF